MWYLQVTRKTADVWNTGAPFRPEVRPSLDLQESLGAISYPARRKKSCSPVLPVMGSGYQSSSSMSAAELSAASSCSSADEEIFWNMTRVSHIMH